MEHIVKSRYGDDRIYTIISNKEVLVKAPKCLFTRCLGSTEHILALDFDGGPFLQIENDLKLGDYTFKIKSIKKGLEKGTWKLTVVLED